MVNMNLEPYRLLFNSSRIIIMISTNETIFKAVIWNILYFKIQPIIIFFFRCRISACIMRLMLNEVIGPTPAFTEVFPPYRR